MSEFDPLRFAFLARQREHVALLRRLRGTLTEDQRQAAEARLKVLDEMRERKPVAGARQ